MNEVEARIVSVARDVFIEKGFSGASMSEIAQGAGLNRPTLHYYFRTKEKLFQAVFGDIIRMFLPRVKEIMMSDRPIGERFGMVADAYYEELIQAPCLVIFLINEINRDVDNILVAIDDLGVDQYFRSIFVQIHSEMQEGKLKKMPVYEVLMTFYGMLLMPVVTRKMVMHIAAPTDEQYRALLNDWKSRIVSQMEHLLLP